MTAEEFLEHIEEGGKYTFDWKEIAIGFAKYQAIAFHNWMRKNDIPENAEKFFGHTDEDMLNVFKEETRW